MPRYLLSIAITLFLMVVSRTAGGQTSPPAEAEKPKTSILTHKGVKGVWFPLPIARSLLLEIRQCRNKNVILEKTSRLLELAKHRNALYTLDQQNLETQVETWKAVAQTQAKKLQAKTAWYNSKPFWFALGFVAATVTASAGAYLMYSISK